MNRPEIAQLLALCASFDQRTVGESDVHAWHYAISDLDFATCCEAVKEWYRSHDEGRIGFQELRRAVKAVRGRRLSARPMPVPDADPDDPAAYQRAMARQINQLAEGLDVGRQLAAPPALAPPPEITRRDGRDTVTVAALLVDCPWCGAHRGHRCRYRTSAGWVPLAHTAVHPSRQAAAAQEAS